MTFVTLFSDEHGFLASDQTVFSPEELKPLQTVIDQAKQLDQRLDQQKQREEKAFATAMERGRLEGLAQGRAEASVENAKQLRQWHEQHAQAVEQVRDSCAELAVDIVRKIAGNINTDQWLLAQAQQAAEDVLDEVTIKLRVHTSRAETVRALLAKAEHSRISSVVADDTLTEQACILDTGSGQIDVGLDTQLNSVLAVFEGSTYSAGEPGG